jgi:hypothetical protein
VKGKCNSNASAEISSIADLVLNRYLDAEKRKANNFPTVDYCAIRVDKEMGQSSMLWAKSSNGNWANVGYEDYPIPRHLLQKFESYSTWFDKHANDARDRYEEHLKMREFKQSISMELQCVLGSEYTVYVWDAAANRYVEARERPGCRAAA